MGKGGVLSVSMENLKNRKKQKKFENCAVEMKYGNNKAYVKDWRKVEEKLVLLRNGDKQAFCGLGPKYVEL